jgi:NADPH:quinone reductase-like Zn-dependent oxidoreductase
MSHGPIRALIRKFGPAEDVVTVEECRPESPGPGQVRVRMQTAAINPSDLVTISGAYAHRTPLPFVPGFEGVGMVEDVGEGVADLLPGDRVLPIGDAGAWQDVKIAEARWCFRIDPGLSLHQAATSYINPLTAWLMLHEHAEIGPETNLVLNAAGSAIGRIIIRMANTIGIRPVAVVRSAQGARLLDGLDLLQVIITERDDLNTTLQAIALSRPIDLALDAVGGAEGESLTLSLRPGGHLIHYGLLSGIPLASDLSTRRPDVRIDYFWLRRWIHQAERSIIEDRLSRVARLIGEGIAASIVEDCYPLTEIRQAIRHSQRRGRSGKILIQS